VVIEQNIREQLGVGPGWVALQRLVGNRVELTFVPPEHKHSLRGSLAKHTKIRVGRGGAWDRAREAAWAAAAEERERPARKQR
jgi:hypothetical protein